MVNSAIFFSILWKLPANLIFKLDFVSKQSMKYFGCRFYCCCGIIESMHEQVLFLCRIFGRTINPWNPMRTPGGSSGGEAALVSLRGSPLGIASDVGGSIRIPSSFCGSVGFKPTPEVKRTKYILFVKLYYMKVSFFNTLL